MKITFLFAVYPFIFFLVASNCILLDLHPASLSTSRELPADVLFCLAASWILRQPHLLPPLLIGAIWFFQDVVFGMPLGLWTAIAVLALEFLRSQSRMTQPQPFIFEWLLFSAVYIAATFAYQLVLLLTLTSTPPILEIVRFLTVTLLAYPLVVSVTNHVFRIFKSPRSNVFWRS